MKQYILLIICAIAIVACGGKKKKPWEMSDEERHYLHRGIQVHDSLNRVKFLNEYSVLDAREVDSVLVLTLTEVREGTDVNALAKQTYDAAVSSDVKFKACVILDADGKEIGRYE